MPQSMIANQQATHLDGPKVQHLTLKKMPQSLIVNHGPQSLELQDSKPKV